MCLSWLRYNKASEILHSMKKHQVDNYLSYWNDIAPKTHQDYYERWLFAFMSVQTSWKENVKLFKALRALSGELTEDSLRQCLLDNRSGLIGNRTKGIWQFHQSFWQEPKNWYPQAGETIGCCRDRLVDMIFGLGTAKVSFVLEMAFPSNCDVICVDVHIARLYGLKNPYEHKMTSKAYKRIEQHWTRQCKASGLPAAIARHVYWDTIQGQSSTRYWSHVFEAA